MVLDTDLYTVTKDGLRAPGEILIPGLSGCVRWDPFQGKYNLVLCG